MEARTLRTKKTLLWAGTAVTAGAAVFFPGVQGIRDTGDSWWRLATFFLPQGEGLVLVPIIFGGLGAALGAEGRRRRATEGRGALAAAAIAVGAAAFAVSAAIWVFAEELRSSPRTPLLVRTLWTP